MDELEEVEQEKEVSQGENQEATEEEEHKKEVEPEQKEERKPSSLSSTEEFDLFWSLKKVIEFENESERCKQDLSLRYEFNLFDAFSVLDNAGQGEIFRFEFTDALKKLGIYADRSEVELFYRKFDSN